MASFLALALILDPFMLGRNARMLSSIISRTKSRTAKFPQQIHCIVREKTDFKMQKLRDLLSDFKGLLLTNLQVKTLSQRNAPEK